ncbi:thyrostimulin beta-5 subunit [Lingula anatina]|uniref:Thyrostimulin beta-5 subunit n=1 Tax=Lingula anatina TaxID=7574 RepID=A0A1S3KEA1_LINAN|nr:thyrostimulin beta-5 subunit [Lingula anatina]|eukprot:XP_013420784.1 thyrostimulin beta-5 subunit [Lingula anatina]
MISFHCLLVAVLVLCVPMKTVIGCNPGNVLSCLETEYTYTINKPYQDPDTGEELHCYDEVTVYACCGRCQSYEYGEIGTPFKISEHYVCTYKTKTPRTVTLTHCHPDHPDPTAEVFDATCECRKCSSDDTSCENS